MDKYVVLALGSWALFCAYWATDVPAALHDRLQAAFSPEHLSMSFAVFFGLQYSLYSLPNVVLPFVGGFLVMRHGAGPMMVVFCWLLVLGQALQVLGLWVLSMPTVLVGRALYGAGAESLCVGVSALLARWFAGGNVALAMGLSLAVSRLGSVVNDVVSPALADAAGVTLASSVALLLLVAAGLASLLARSMEDAKTARELRAGLEARQRRWAAETPEAAAAAEVAGAVPLAEPEPGWRTLLQFPAAFWVICLSCATVYGVIIPWNSISSALLIERACGGLCCPAQPAAEQTCAAHAAAERSASLYMTIPYAISGAAVPFLGLAVDAFGLRAALSLGAAATLLCVHVVLATSAAASVVPLLVLQGSAYAVYAAALWPSVPLVVPDERAVGLAYGLITSVQNLALCLVPLGVAGVRSASGGYAQVEWLFVALAAAGTASGIALNWLDWSQLGSALNRTTVKSAGLAGPAGSDPADPADLASGSLAAAAPALKPSAVEQVATSARRLVENSAEHLRASSSLEDSEDAPLLAKGPRS
jgi:MFS family permease